MSLTGCLAQIRTDISACSGWLGRTACNDSNPGTSASPWKTIQKAANTLNGGGTVIVNAGTYNQRVQVITSGSAGKLLTFQAQGTVVMQGFNIQASCVKLTGFEITNTPGSTNRSCQRIRSLSVGKQH